MNKDDDPSARTVVLMVDHVVAERLLQEGPEGLLEEAMNAYAKLYLLATRGEPDMKRRMDDFISEMIEERTDMLLDQMRAAVNTLKKPVAGAVKRPKSSI